jgi:hypothetical protein
VLLCLVTVTFYFILFKKNLISKYIYIYIYIYIYNTSGCNVHTLFISCLYWNHLANKSKILCNYNKYSDTFPFNNHTKLTALTTDFELSKHFSYLCNIDVTFHHLVTKRLLGLPWLYELKIFQIHPCLNILTVPNWPNVKVDHPLIGLKLKFLLISSYWLLIT